MEFYYVYILKDKSESHHYIGVTSNLKLRLQKHNEGGCPHTSRFRPWTLQAAISFSDKDKAYKFERYLKSGSGRQFALRHF